MAGDGAHGFSPLMEHWIAGILATLREFTLLYAPNDQLVQAVREGHASRRRASRGASTTAPARCG